MLSAAISFAPRRWTDLSGGSEFIAQISGFANIGVGLSSGDAWNTIAPRQ
jgi:hypothetical protein